MSNVVSILVSKFLGRLVDCPYRSFRTAVGVLLVPLLLTGCVGHLQKKMIFPGTRNVASDPSTVDLPFEAVTLNVGRHTTAAWFVPLDDARGVVLYSHGNGGNLSNQLDAIAMLRSFGLSVFAYDYGGYGESTGRPSEQRCYADVHAAWSYLTETRGIPPEDIVLFGRSLGGGPTAELAQHTTPGAVILESTFLSIGDVARDRAFKPVSGLVRHRFRNKEKIGALRSPVLIIHSPEDDVVPFHHGTGLFALAPEPKWFLEVHGGHNTPYAVQDPAYRPAWEAFLEPVLGPNPLRSAA